MEGRRGGRDCRSSDYRDGAIRGGEGSEGIRFETFHGGEIDKGGDSGRVSPFRAVIRESYLGPWIIATVPIFH